VAADDRCVVRAPRVVGVALALVATIGFALCAGAPDGGAACTRFQPPAPDKHLLAPGGAGVGLVTVSSLSPDGTRLVFYAADQLGKGALWLRALDSFEARRLPETEEGFQPFWSPDSRSIAFFAGRRMYRLDVASGERREVCAFEGNARGGSWGATGSIIFATGNPSDLDARGVSRWEAGASIQLQGSENYLPPVSWPSFLPDGHSFLYSRARKPNQSAQYTWRRSSRKTKAEGCCRAIRRRFCRSQGICCLSRRAALSPGVRSCDPAVVRGRFRRRSPARSFVGRSGEFSASNTGVLAYRSGLMRRTVHVGES
jgi:hypothetical protein